MSLNIYTSNRMENLAEAFAEVLKKPLTSPLTPEVVVVQSRGMQRWLAMELAGYFGVWANSNYPFPNAMIQQLFATVLEDVPDSSSFTPDIMTWKILDLFPKLLQRDEFLPLRHYLADDQDGLKGFQLAEKIADTFDQYTLFRPLMLLEWERGDDEGWQSVLWRELLGNSGEQHRGQLMDAYRLQIAGNNGEYQKLPERISLFGISYLPKYHLEILAATAQITEVNLFLLSPTREYWADILSSKEQARLTPAERALRIEGNPLLASLGKLGRDFSDMVIETGDLASVQEDLYFDSGHATLLQSLQSDILNLSGSELDREKIPLDSEDHSVQIHSCHSPMREIEVLHDQILNLLEQQEGLEPRDILVMTTDIEIYAPYIVTVFEGCQDPALKIPFSIADRSLANDGEIVAVLLKLLLLPDSRLTVVELLDILEATPVRKRFDLDEDELEMIRGWLEDVRVRWGLNEEDRVRFGLPSYRENSLQAGLDRLLLGYAMPSSKGSLFNDISPYDDIEGSNAGALGKLCEFVSRISSLRENLKRPQTLGQWSARIRTLLADFIADDEETAREAALVADLVTSLGGFEEKSAFSGEVSLKVVRSWLSDRLEQAEQNFGFMTGGVTFCAMLPMRSIPFKVIALIGMNDGAFPRQTRPPGFDLIAQHPQRGDRSLRDEDRYLFLEALLSARQCFYLSFVG
ncbi:MAG: exodeoxyribonuclease V subunit gamma, partial [Desulfuromusa sp.]|nr:exodeoxyribonuclease V subunit gamma [Desulfuromusa sp.]